MRRPTPTERTGISSLSGFRTILLRLRRGRPASSLRSGRLTRGRSWRSLIRNGQASRSRTGARSPMAHAVEIYNHGCALECARGDGTVLLDQLVNEGRRLTAIATDDAHFRLDDACGGWVMVKAEENDPRALLAALKAGSFYSSHRPGNPFRRGFGQNSPRRVLAGRQYRRRGTWLQSGPPPRASADARRTSARPVRGRLVPLPRNRRRGPLRLEQPRTPRLVIHFTSVCSSARTQWLCNCRALVHNVVRRARQEARRCG